MLHWQGLEAPVLDHVLLSSPLSPVVEEDCNVWEVAEHEAESDSIGGMGTPQDLTGVLQSETPGGRQRGLCMLCASRSTPEPVLLSTFSADCCSPGHAFSVLTPLRSTLFKTTTSQCLQARKDTQELPGSRSQVLV